MTTIWKGALAGALGGLAGAWAMQGFRTVWDGREQATPQGGIFGFDEEADLNTIDKLCELALLPPLSREEALRAAAVLHYTYGALAGSAYGALSERFPATGWGLGTMFGASLWLVGDELAITVSGLSDPWSKTGSSHLSALFAHLLFGSVTALTHRVFRSDSV